MSSVRSKWTRAARMGRAFQAAIMPHLKNEGLRFGVAVDGSQVRARPSVGCFAPASAEDAFLSRWTRPPPTADAPPRGRA